ncbi:MAG: sensor histidine kinase [Marinifilaceae bacterium]
MNKVVNNIPNALLFSGLGLFAYYLLVNFAHFPGGVQQQLSSITSILFFVGALNILGFATMRLGSWLHYQYALSLKKRNRISFIYIGVAFLLLVLNYGLIVCAKLLVGSAAPLTFPHGGIRVLVIVWLVELIILGLLVMNRSMKQSLQLQQHAADLQKENNTARYTALQNQLNPHFLFNSLNTLIAEIEYNPQSAVVFTRQLSEVYRYVLHCQDKPLISLKKELEFTKAYLFLHTVRWGNAIHCNISIANEFMEAQLPPLTLQLLVENIMKHNTVSQSKPMNIDIQINNHYLEVSNTLQRKRNAESNGTGLNNLSRRCKLILGRDIVIAPSQQVFTVKVPLLYA